MTKNLGRQLILQKNTVNFLFFKAKYFSKKAYFV